MARTDTESELLKAVKWVLEDAAFKAPEQMGDPAIYTRWFDRLRDALPVSSGEEARG